MSTRNPYRRPSPNACLPIVRRGGREYYYDSRLGQLRCVDEPRRVQLVTTRGLSHLFKTRLRELRAKGVAYDVVDLDGDGHVEVDAVE